MNDKKKTMNLDSLDTLEVAQAEGRAPWTNVSLYTCST